MTPRRRVLRLLTAAALLAPLAGCGRKGPPKRSDGSSGIKVDAKKPKKNN